MKSPLLLLPLLFCVGFRQLIRAARGISTPCQSELDCSLNGVCNTTTLSCDCDDPWHGDTCGLLRRGPAPPPGGIYGVEPNVTSWGGNVVQDDQGLWHLYVAEMAGKGCGLHVWGSQSEVTHATAESVEGPYTKLGTVINAEAHNPQMIRVNGTWYIFHIGSGTGSVPKACNETVARPSFAAPPLRVPQRRQNAARSHGGGGLHKSDSPNGPFERVPGYDLACNNPSPYLAPNGTLFLLCTWNLRRSENGNPEGPWTAPIQLNPHETDARHWEDPFLWIDQRGNFHALSHVWSSLPYPSNSISGHIYSKDGLDWHFSDVEPYGNTIVQSDGTVREFATLERPKLIFSDPTRPHVPTHLINGASSVGWLANASNPCSQCGMGHCSHCKQEVGIDWTYTVITPLGSSIPSV